MSDNISIQFPPHFRALKNLPGYFWHIEEKRLYSLKIGGVLRPLKMQKYDWQSGRPIYWEHYQISTKGRRFRISVDRIERMIEAPHIMPVEKS